MIDIKDIPGFCPLCNEKLFQSGDIKSKLIVLHDTQNTDCTFYISIAENDAYNNYTLYCFDNKHNLIIENESSNLLVYIRNKGSKPVYVSKESFGFADGKAIEKYFHEVLQNKLLMMNNFI